MSTLTLDRIAELLATTKQRGVYVTDIDTFAKSEELACAFSDLPYYKGKDPIATRNSIVGNIEKHAKEMDWPTLSVVYDKADKKDKSTWTVVLINMDVLASEQADASDDTDDTEEV